MVSGKLEFHLQSANLTHDVKLLGTMNPYVVILMGATKKTSAANQSGGKHPKWIDKLDFHRQNEESVLIEVLNLRKLGLFDNDIIGSATYPLNQLMFATN